MRICRFRRADGDLSLGLIVDGRIFDLGSGNLTELINDVDMSDRLESAAERLGPGRTLKFEDLDIPPEREKPHLLAPITEQEVWGAGVTYLRSREARMDESPEGGSFYDRVYTAERPELFFKATPGRVSGPNTPIRIRSDSRWTVPEPELALVVNSRGELAGFTIGNDVSARDIEGENPLYLPQAKVYQGCCALGPAIAPVQSAAGIIDSTIRLCIRRGGKVCFDGSTSIRNMKRRFDELTACLFREQMFPEGVILLTGTGIVPPDDFALQPGDVVEISIPEIGTLRNPVC
jgi:2-dehydro-3-deoxy-D-arabinonate dehydratase